MFWWWGIASMYNNMDEKERKDADKSFNKFMIGIFVFLALIFLCYLIYAGYHCLIENIIPNMKHILR